MKVKVGNKIYDGIDEPVMVILSKTDILNISCMRKEDSKYCSFPDGYDTKEIEKWMMENEEQYW